ncbi:MAG: 16S rRNA (guanine(527)-N(7))-methyltransferase RsmG [Bacteroidales bacterium]|jgi:16S rRNA (guanine527-N7)-methyltransferase|nr:16S rRNA (guanine(527)-N(7))-methyltransferase RsmG [Bacteroidales bacterium]
MEIIKKYFPGLTQKQYKQFESLQAIYSEWNRKINVISRKDIDHLYERHVLHSLAIAKIIAFKPQTKILDAGTGGGFPGIPLAILFPDAHFYLADSIAKKIKVVHEVTRAIELKNINAEQIRAEKIKSNFDFVVSRAVTSLPVFYNWVKGKISATSTNDLSNGIIYLKGGDLTEEIKKFKPSVKVLNINHYFEEPFFETKKIIYLPIKF